MKEATRIRYFAVSFVGWAGCVMHYLVSSFTKMVYSSGLAWNKKLRQEYGYMSLTVSLCVFRGSLWDHHTVGFAHLLGLLYPSTKIMCEWQVLSIPGIVEAIQISRRRFIIPL
jgi:hypothetical protein